MYIIHFIYVYIIHYIYIIIINHIFNILYIYIYYNMYTYHDFMFISTHIYIYILKKNTYIKNIKTCEARIRPQDSSRTIPSRKHREVASISLGQGQGPKAERLMDIATKAAG